MAKTYTGSLTLEWYNKQKSIITSQNLNNNEPDSIPAAIINWVNKDYSLFYEINVEEGSGLKPYWVDNSDIRVREARPLLLFKTFSAKLKNKTGTLPGLINTYKVDESTKDNETIDNILIRGDNLLALNSLKKEFENRLDEDKIKCIYIDPPYNTGQAFDDYDDNLEHSQWLSMMRDRLVALKELLRIDGIIFIQIDQRELAYLKVLCDEVFGRDNFLIQINWQRTSQRTVLGQGATPVINIVEYILVYLKNIEYKDEAIRKIEKYYEADEKVFNQYGLLIRSEGEKKLFKEIEHNGNNIKFYKHINPQINTIDIGNKNYDFYIKNLEFIARRDAQQKESSLEQIILSHIEKDDQLYSVERILKQGKHKGQIKRTFYQNENVIYFLKTYAKVENGKLMRKVDMNNIWLDTEISSAGIADEGGVQFKRSKKPEALIERILSMSTEEGDIVLDSFAGSGTTLAVAHKMKRKWIGIEIGKQCDDFIVERMKHVLDGTDSSGISKNENISWQGGGGFKYYHLGDSFIKVSNKGFVDFNWTLGKENIEELFLISYDYRIDKSIDFSSDNLFKKKENSPMVGYKKIGSKYRAAIVSLNEPNGNLGNITYDELQVLYRTVKKKYSPEYINIFTNRGIEIAFDSKPEDLEVIKVPHAIFAELEK